MKTSSGDMARADGVLSWAVAALMPVAIVMTAVRLLLAPWFLRFEYATPNFPEDPYGFTLEERLHWSSLSLEYLVNDAGIEFIEALRFEDGSPVFNERERAHFIDVKVILTAALWVWRGALLLLALLAFWAWKSERLDAYARGLGRGGWLTAAAIGVIILFVVLSFRVFFVAFHNVFFPPGTWTFNWSDTFIRLFPERFWRDIFIYVGVFSAAVGAALGYFTRRSRRA